jgi:hypothetical protein
VQYIERCTERGLSSTREIVRNFAGAVANQDVSHAWVLRFLHRHEAELTVPLPLSSPVISHPTLRYRIETHFALDLPCTASEADLSAPSLARGGPDGPANVLARSSRDRAPPPYLLEVVHATPPNPARSALYPPSRASGLAAARSNTLERMWVRLQYYAMGPAEHV